MEPFATPTQMEARSLGAITATTHPFLSTELAAASRAIRNECRWHVWPMTTLTRRTRTGRWGPIWIPAMQISEVWITPDGADEMEIPDSQFDPGTGWTSWSGDSYTLRYTAGYTDVPADLVALTLQVAARALGSPLGLVREQAGGVSVTYSQPGFNVAGGNTLLAHELASLSEYRLGRLP